MSFVTPPVAAMSPGAGRFRHDIQGLRALAVLLVLFFHIWPELLPGGYVGVDVFFVISGYLITGLLLREVEQTGRVSLKRFYARRIRRLVPAATAVIVAVSVGTVALMPVMGWGDVALDAAASAFYVQNWLLAWRAVDYLGAESAASPLLHFWSLAIEEQFYLVWPWLFIALAHTSLGAAGKLRSRAGLLIGVAIAASLAYSVIATRENAATAYFVTGTRIWELALGGVLAVIAPRLRIGAIAGAVLVSAGLLAIAVAAFLYGPATPFPGVVALVPTLGASAVLVGGMGGNRLSGLLGTKPGLYIGGISYSLYLWHWPLVVFATFHLDGPLGLGSGLAVAAASLVLADLSKRFIEDRFHHKARQVPERDGRVFAAAAVCGCVCLGITLALSVAVAKVERARASVLPDLGDYPGALTLSHGVESPPMPEAGMSPSIELVRKDVPDIYPGKCHVDAASTEPDFCSFGSPTASVSVALVGDSHAGQWLPALQSLAAERGWRIRTFTKSRCGFVDAPLTNKDGSRYVECEEWNRRVLAELLREPPALVVTTLFSEHVAFGSGNDEDNQHRLADGLVRHWEALQAAGTEVVAIRDTPWMKRDVARCIAANPKKISKCETRRELAFARPDPVGLAASRLRGVRFLDLSDSICEDELCRVIVGNVLVYRDRHHLTTTYVDTLVPEFTRQLDQQ